MTVGCNMLTFSKNSDKCNWSHKVSPWGCGFLQSAEKPKFFKVLSSKADGDRKKLHQRLKLTHIYLYVCKCSVHWCFQVQVKLSSWFTEWGLPQFAQQLKCNLNKKKFNLIIPCLEVEVVLYLNEKKVMHVSTTLHTHIQKVIEAAFFLGGLLISFNWSFWIGQIYCLITSVLSSQLCLS